MEAPAPAPASPAKTRPADAAWVSSTYFGEGLPWSFLHQMGTEYLTAIGAPLAQVGYTSWLHLSVTLKFLWSPFVDFFSTKRRWMVVMQCVLGLGMLAIAMISERRNLPLFWTMMAVLSVMHATHDIACDGYYMIGLSDKAQALYVGVRVAAFYVARVVGSGALVYLAGRTDWRLGFGTAGIIMTVVGLANARFLPRFPEPARKRENTDAGKHILERIKSSNFFTAYRTFFSQPQAGLVLSFMFLFRIGDIMMFAMSSPLLRDIGVDTAHRGILRGIGQVVFIVSSMTTGALVAKISLRRSLIPMIYIQNFAILLYILMAVVKPGFAGVTAIYVAEQTASGIGATAHMVFMMQRTKRAFSASHFAFATAIVALASTLSGAISGHLDARLGHPWYFTLAFVLSVPSLVMVLFVPRDPIDQPAT